LWHRFADACGIQPGVVDPDAIAPANTSLTTEAIALLRALNVALAGELTPREHARFVKRDIAEGRLAGRPGTPPRTPGALADVFVPAASAWRDEIEAAGHPVHGELADLTPVLGVGGEPHPDDVPPGVPDPAEVAALAEEVVGKVRRERAAARVDSGHDGAGDSGGSADALRAAVGGLWRRVRVRRG
jgi:hypothetical protein